MYERLGLGITLDVQDNASPKVKNIVNNFENLINVSGRMVKGMDAGLSSLHFEGLTVAGFALERLATTMNMYGMRIIRGFVGIGKAVVDAGTKMEKYEKIFEVFFKGQKNAQEKIGWAMDYAAKTPYEMSDVLNTMKAMKAIGVDVTETVKGATADTKNLMDVLGNLAILAPAEQGIRGMMIGIRNLYGGNERSFTMRMDIKPSQILGHAVGKTTKEITDSLVELSQKLTPDMMKKLFGTWDQTVSNFSDQYERLLYTLNKQGAFDVAKKSLMNLYLTISRIQGEELQTLGKNLADVFAFLWKPVDLFSKALSKLIIAFKDLSSKYPLVMKIIAGIALSSGVFLIAGGAIMKFAGVVIMFIAAIATFYVNIVIFRFQTELLNTALLRSIKYIGLFVKGFILSAFLMGTAIYAYEKNLFGFRDTVLEVTEDARNAWNTAWDAIYGKSDESIKKLRELDGLAKRFAKIIAVGQLLKILFTQDDGDNVYFYDRQKMNLTSLGLWDFAVALVMLKKRVSEFIKGFAEGFKFISGILKTFFKTVLAPIKALFEGLDKIISSITGKKTPFGMIVGNTGDLDRYKQLGGSLGRVLAILVGFKVVRSLGTVLVSPFLLLSRTLTGLGEKIKWSGGLLRNAFGKIGTPFYYEDYLRGRSGKRSNKPALIDLMNAESDEASNLKYSRNPFKRFMEQRRMYNAVSDLKKMELAEVTGSSKGAMLPYLQSGFRNRYKEIMKQAEIMYPDVTSREAFLQNTYMNKEVFRDPTQGALSRIFMGRKNLVFGEKTIDINGQKIKAPEVREFREGGLLAPFFNRFGGGGYNDVLSPDANSGDFLFGRTDQRNIVKNSFKNAGRTLLENMGIISPQQRRERLRSLNRAIVTMKSRGNTRQLPSMLSQSRNLMNNGDASLADYLLDLGYNVKGGFVGVRRNVYDGISGAVNYVGNTRVGRVARTAGGRVYGAGQWIGGKAGRLSNFIEAGTGINLRNLPKEAGKALPKGAWNLTKGAGRGVLGAGGMALRGLGALGGGLLAAAPWLAAGGAIGGAIFNKLSGGVSAKDGGVDIAQANLKKITEQMQKNGPETARKFFESFKSQGKETFGLIKEFVITAFKSIKDSGILTEMWEGVKAGALYAWKWIQTQGATYLGLVIKWVITDGIPLLIKGFLKLLRWFATDFIPTMLKILGQITVTLLGVMKEAIVGGITAAINAVASFLPEWVKKMFGGKSTITMSDIPEEYHTPGAGTGSYIGGRLGVTKEETLPAWDWSKQKTRHHSGLWMSENEHQAIIRKDETVLPPGISRKLNASLEKGNLGGGVNIKKVEVVVHAERLSQQDARQQAMMILKELGKLKTEDVLRKGSSSLSFA